MALGTVFFTFFLTIFSIASPLNSLQQRYACWHPSETLASLKLCLKTKHLSVVRLHNIFLFTFTHRYLILSSIWKMHSYKVVALYVWNGAELWLSFWSEVHYNSLYDNQGLSFCLQSVTKWWLCAWGHWLWSSFWVQRFQFSRSQRENIGCSRKQASHIDNIFEFYSFSIVHKSTVSDAVTLPSYLYTHELAWAITFLSQTKYYPTNIYTLFSLGTNLYS